MAHSGPPLEDRLVPGFAPLLGADLLNTLEVHDASVFAAWGSGLLAYVNPAWFKMAAENGGEAIPTSWSIGADFWSVVPEVLVAPYRQGWNEALGMGMPFEHTYECSSPDRQRMFHMRLVGLGRSEGILSVHSLVVDAPHGATPSDFLAARYVGKGGMVTMCASCRRTKRADLHGVWDWVPLLLRNGTVAVSHGLCPPCVELYWPAAPGSTAPGG